jgi:hypothetical protein
MGLGPFIVIIKELKVDVFNAKGKREIPRSQACHTRALACLASAEGEGVT